MPNGFDTTDEGAGVGAMVGMDVAPIEVPKLSYQDLEVEAFSILNNAPDYNTGVTDLIDYYESNEFDDPTKARDVLSSYGQDLRFKFKERPLDFESVLEIAPIKPEAREGQSLVEQINDWESSNLAFLDSTDDPDYLTLRKDLRNQIESYASEARRDELGGRGDGVWAWTADKFYRAGSGAISPFARLLGLDDVDKALYERTQRERDDGLAGMVAAGLGSTVPFVAGALAGGGVGAGAVLAAQAGGEARNIYEESLQATGDEERALLGAGVTAASFGVMALPVGRAMTGLTRATVSAGARIFGKEVVEEAAERSINEALLASLNAQKQSFGNVASGTIEAGVMGSAGAILSNIGQNIALDQNGDITAHAADAFLSNAILAGVGLGGKALLENRMIEQTKRTLKELDAPPPPKPDGADPLKKTDAELIEESEPLFDRQDGYWIARDETAQTVREREAYSKNFEKEFQDYVNEEPADPFGKLTTEEGAEVSLPGLPDYDVPDFPERMVMLDESQLTPEFQGAISPNRFMTYLFSKLGATFQADRNIVDGAFGAFMQKDNKIRVLRSLGANPELLSRVLAHEGGHFIDGYLNNAFKRGALKDVAEKVSGVRTTVIEALLPEGKEVNAAVRAEAKDISMKWRPGWDGGEAPESATKSGDGLTRLRAYRSNPKEVYADVVSAVLNNPKWVRDNYPNLMGVFETRLVNNPELNQFWTWFQRMENDPQAILDFNLEVSRDARSKQGVLEAASRMAKQERKSLQRSTKDNLALSYQLLFNATKPAKNWWSSLDKETRTAAADMMNDVSRRGFAYEYIKREIDLPLQNEWWAKLLQDEIDPNTASQYAWAKRVRDDKTNAMGRIEEDPTPYYKAANYLRVLLGSDPRVKKSILSDILNPEKLTSPEALTDALAQINLIGDTAEIYSFQDFLERYPPEDPNRQQKAVRAYGRAVANLNRKKESFPIEELREKIGKLKPSNELTPEVISALEDVVTPGAFAARKYLLNAGGYTINDAVRDIGGIRDRLGPEKFAKLEQRDAEYHQILAKPIKLISKAGIFTPEMIERMTRNQDNYVTNTVLRFFSGDENVKGTMHKMIGSLSETGNELASTPVKMKAIVARAYNQIAVNSAVKLADLAGDVVESRPKKWMENIFTERDKLSRSDPDHSYLITYAEGKPFLNKIAGGKGAEKMFERYSGNPVLDTFLDVTDRLSKASLTRQMKTVLSPAFAFNQKFLDRKHEALISNSFEVTLGLPVHTSGKLRAIDKKSIEEIAHYKKTGELTGRLKKAVDLDGAALSLAQYDTEGGAPHASIESAIYEAFGQKMPGDNIFERIGTTAENFLDKTPLKFFKDIAERDELRTKLNGFAIGKEIFGMSNAEAATFARERFGVPDPMGGGVLRPAINRMFLFGGAHIAGLRVLASIARDMPKTAMSQLAYRVVLPKLLFAAPIMGAVLRSTMGEEEAQKYQNLWQKIPTNDKMSKTVMLLGAQDGQGNFHNFFDIDPSEIQSDWKAWYTRLPQSRELTAVTKVFWPLIEELSKGDVGGAFAGAAKGAASTFGASVQPMIQYGINLGQMAFGYNPTDFFRMKGIIPKDTFEGGSTFQKASAFGEYVLSQQAPSIIPYDPFRTSEAVGAGENVIRKVPVAGPMVRSMIGISNYGDYEATKEGQVIRQQAKSELILSTDDDTKDLITEYRRAAATISSIGEGWKEKVGPDVAVRFRALTSWHSRVWQKYADELQAAKDAGDDERYTYLLSELEKSSSQVLSSLPEASSVEED